MWRRARSGAALAAALLLLPPLFHTFGVNALPDCSFTCTWPQRSLWCHAQRYICRIIFIVPFYCTASWLALLEPHKSLFFETPRDWCGS